MPSPESKSESESEPAVAVVVNSPFSLSASRYDLSTYIGRTLNFFAVFNPVLLLVTDSQLNESKELLRKFKANEFSAEELCSQPQASQALNNALWKARTQIEAIIHPQTHEKIPMPFRMSAFVPMNLPTVCGMLLTSSVSAGIFWQWFNQSYNVCLNFANGNKSNVLSNEKILGAYSIAVLSSCSVSLGLNKMLAKSAHVFGKNTYYLLSKTVPFTAVATAGALNVIFMRYNEMQFGIDITDEQGHTVGKSQIAGKRAVLQTAFSRVVLPAPILLFPPFVLRAFNSTAFVQRRPHLHFPINVSVFVFFLWAALPMACGLFPQIDSVHASQLEPEFHDLGHPKFFYNRGL